jgi:hypothetical protein
MRPGLAILTLAATGVVCQAVAQPPQKRTVAFDDVYSGNYGQFSHWSGVVTYPNNRRALRYAVCNMHKDSLYFRWDKPGFGSGWVHPLPFGKCSTVSIDARTSYDDDDTPITFTTHNEIKKAGAFLPKAAEAPPFTLSIIQTFFRKEAASTIVDFSIRSQIRDGRVSYTVQWSQGLRTVALKIPDAVAQTVMADLSRSGMKSQFQRAADVVGQDDFNHLGGSMQDSRYLTIEGETDAAFATSFSYSVERGQSTLAPILLLDQEKRVVATTIYESIQ